MSNEQRQASDAAPARPFYEFPQTAFGPMTERVLDGIEKRAELMAWDEHADDPRQVIPGSLADQFWNKDVPRLLAFVKGALDA